MITITLDAPGRNALSSDLMESVLERLERAHGEPLLFIGAPGSGAFSAGLNLKQLVALDSDEMFAFLDLLERFMTAIYLYPGPTVACVNGHAIAGGAVITACCDHRVVVDDPRVRIGLNEIALGVRFPPRVLEIVRRRVPSYERVILGGELFDPASAVAMGLVDELASDVEHVARTRLESLARHDAAGYAVTKRDLRGTMAQLCAEDEHALRLRHMVPQWTSALVRDRIAAVLAKR